MLCVSCHTEGWTPERLDTLAGRTFVITGANIGTGFAAARVFLSKGVNVVVLSRNADKSAAAIAQVPKQDLTVDGFESQLGVNQLGHFLLCRLLFERIEASGGRIVVVGSNAYKMGLQRIKLEDFNFDNKYRLMELNTLPYLLGDSISLRC